ncbi:MAG: bifunctional 3-deoxy-7-phosphoheptulonate synthase/chorismate mutase [Myxococcales bacterium]
MAQRDDGNGRRLPAPVRSADQELAVLRSQVDGINGTLLELFSERARLTQRIHAVKAVAGRPVHDPERERQMLEGLVSRNPGPLADGAVAHLFGELFAATKALMEAGEQRALRVARRPGEADAVVRVSGDAIGEAPVLIAGPCSVENALQIDQAAAFLASRGVRFLRGGAYKPRTSPYDFQGLGEAGLELLAAAARRHSLRSVTEVTDTRHVELVCRHADVLQVGARNMQNFELLKEVGRAKRPILLKRGFAATIDELLLAAEYVVSQGNGAVILCERGIRSFGRETRNLLDVSAIALLRQVTALPVIADVSHAAGRKDILAPLARAALAAGAQGILLEVHPCPASARSDAQQQLDFEEFDRFQAAVFGAPEAAARRERA